jgi:NAD(P)-dependent dehydrogenase (short-subunit alcohol dehydrogenase family)
MGRLEKKVALITGGGSGIGRGIALAFAREGADVCVAGRTLSKVQQVKSEIEKIGRRALAIQADVTKMADLDRMVAETISTFNRIDVLVNNAGIILRRPILDTTEAEWDNVMNIDLKAVFFTTQRVLPTMLKQSKGKIINIASTFGAVGAKERCVYCAAKAGIINLTKAMAMELAPKINVNAIGPGLTQTPFTEYVMNNAPMLQASLNDIPMGRVGQPGDMSEAAVYLASDESDFITGQTLFVDGGQVIH